MNRPRIGILGTEILLFCLVFSPWTSSAQTSSDAASGVGQGSSDAEEQEPRAYDLKKLSNSLLSLGLLDAAPAVPRLGIEVGPFYSFDSQSSLSNSFSQTMTVLRDLSRGTTNTTVNTGDPKLNNRKFEFELEFEQSGIRVPIVLPRLSGAKMLAVAFGLEAGVADVSFDVFDTTQPGLSTSFSGDGVAFGAGFDVATCVTVACKWITSTGYWYRYLPSVDVGRVPPLSAAPMVSNLGRGAGFAVVTEAETGIEVLADDATLSRDAHELSFRFGYNLETENRRYAPYTGVIYRRTEIEIEDVAIFRSEELALETTLTSTSRFESDAVLGIVGVEGQVSKSFSGRLESFFGDGDQGVRFQVGWSWWGAGDPEIAEKRDERKQKKREKRARRRFERWEKRFASMVPWLLARIQEIEREYLDRWESLEVIQEPDGPSYRFDDVKALLADTEKDLIEALSSRKARRHGDLTPLRDYVIYHYERTLDLLRPTALQVASAHSTTSPNIVLAAFNDPGRSLVLPAQNETKRPLWVRALEFFGDVFPVLMTAIDRPECRYVTLHFVRGTQEPKTVLALVPYSSNNTLPDNKNLLEFEDESLKVPRGAHGYLLYTNREELEAAKRARQLDRGPRPLLACSADSYCALDLAKKPYSELNCTADLDSPARSYCLQRGQLLPDHCF